MSDSNTGKSGDRKHPFIFSRRTFVKLSALAGAALAVSRFLARPALGSPRAEAAPVTGVLNEKWTATSCLNCATRCATRVRVVNGRAVKVTGNPLDAVSEGKTCPRAHIGLQVLYDSNRLTGPMKRTNPVKGRGIDPGWAPVSWEQALSEVTDRLKSLRAKGNPERLAVFTGLNSVSDDDLIRRLADACGTPNLVSDAGLDNESVRSGEWLADGHFTQSAYDLERTNYILAFGAGILESEKPLARNLHFWGKIHRERPNRVKVVTIDPRYSVTAARSDQWVPIKPGTDGALALAIANLIMAEGLHDTGFIRDWTTGFEDYQEAVKPYTPEKAAEITGIPAETIRQIAREFATTKPAIAWRGRGATGWPGGSYASYAIFCLNALVGNIDIPGGVIYQEDPGYRAMPDIAADGIAAGGRSKAKIDLRQTGRFPLAEVATNQAADAIISEQPYPVEMAIGFNSNFSMSAPAASRWDQALQKVFYVHVAPFAGEMGQLADILLPASTFLESWGYDHSPPGSGFAEVKLKQPVVDRLHDSRVIADVVFDLARKLGGSVGQSFSGIGDDAPGFVKYRTGNLVAWDKLCEQGIWIGPAYQYRKYGKVFQTPSKKFEFRSGNLEARLKQTGQTAADKTVFLPHFEEPRFQGDAGRYNLLLTTYHPVLHVENGSQNYPWAQEFFLLEHGAGWGNFAEMNTATARDLRIGEGDAVWVESPFGKIKTKARVFEGIMPGIVAIAAGQGHYAGGRWASGIGVNPNDIMGVDYDQLSGQSAFNNTRVRVYRA